MDASFYLSHRLEFLFVFVSGAVAVFFITLGLAQINSIYQGWRAASLTGPHRWAGYGIGILILLAGIYLLPATWMVLWWTVPAGILTVVILFIAGSFIYPPPDPHHLFEINKERCQAVQIPDGSHKMPGLFLYPSQNPTQTAICLVHGAGDTKTSFKWRLTKSLLAEGLIVLTIDLPGHGEYRHRPLIYPDCLSAIPAALTFLRDQPNIKHIGLLGISLGGAMAIQAATTSSPDALAILETPPFLDYQPTLFYKELWATLQGSPVLTLLREISLKQIRERWRLGGYRSPHQTAELFDLLDPAPTLSRVENMPILLVYSQRDPIAPPEAAKVMRQAAPDADFIESKKASHVMLTLCPEINQQVARWLRQNLFSKSDQ